MRDSVADLGEDSVLCDLRVDFSLDGKRKTQPNQTLHQKKALFGCHHCLRHSLSPGEGWTLLEIYYLGKKTLGFPLSTLLKSFKYPFPLFSPPHCVCLCFYRWLCWPSQLFPETQPGWTLLFSSLLSLVKVIVLQAHMVRQHVPLGQGTEKYSGWGPLCHWAHLDLH